MNNIPTTLIVGPQGVGKGTQATLLADYFSEKNNEKDGDAQGPGAVITASDLLKTDTELKAMLDAGELVSDEIVIEKILQRIPAHQVRLILDGFPRTTKQAEALLRYICSNPTILQLKIPGEEAALHLVRNNEMTKFFSEANPILDRLSRRRVDEITGEPFPPEFPGDTNPKTGNRLVRRPDDIDKKKVWRRLKDYDSHTLPTIAMLRNMGMKHQIIESQPEISETQILVRKCQDAVDNILFKRFARAI